MTQTDAAATVVEVPFVIRGRVISDFAIEHDSGGFPFRTPDPHTLLAELPLRSRVGLARSPHDQHRRDHRLPRGAGRPAPAQGQRALAGSVRAHRAGLEPLGSGPAVAYTTIASPVSSDPRSIRDAVERRLGVRYIEGWAHEPAVDGRDLRIRAFGARITHVVAGNSPGVSAQTIVRNAVTRGDAIIKTPSNDPVTAVAILRTMVDLDADHPLTKHVSAVHWRGGDEAVERVAYSSPNIDKIVAWGGVAAIKHVAKFVGPGVELIALDPKLSISVLGPEVLTDPTVSAEAAQRLAMDVGLMNQEGCVNSRVAYVDVSTAPDPEHAVRTFAQAVFDALQTLPNHYSSPADRVPSALRDEVDAALLTGEPEVIGGGTRAGGVLISWDGRAVDYTVFLAARYLNLVPVPDLSTVVEGISSMAQTCGVYPPELREAMRDQLALAGVQRVVTLGGAAANGDNQTVPQDAIEVLRRMCRWIIDEGDPAERSLALD